MLELFYSAFKLVAFSGMLMFGAKCLFLPIQMIFSPNPKQKRKVR